MLEAVKNKTTCSSIADMHISGDFEGIACWINSRLRPLLPVDSDWVKERLGINHTTSSGDRRLDSTYYIWFKNRLEEASIVLQGTELFKTDSRERDSFTTATLHIGFLSINETPEQLSVLRGEQRLSEEQINLARSRLFNTAILPRPIDKTAFKVAGRSESE